MFDTIQEKIKEFVEPMGVEAYPFKIGWYNDEVHKCFKFNYDYDTVAFLLVSTPAMFDKLFIPFLEKWDGKGNNDPLDLCMRKFFQQLAHLFPDQEIETAQDFEFFHSKRPKILVQTAGHVSGAVYYFQRKDIKQDDPWPESKKIFGVCLHPKYGGWIGLRGVIIFKKLLKGDLERRTLQCFISNQQIITLLDKFNHSWKDGSFRDVVDPLERYSPLQQHYFTMNSDQREEWIRKLKIGTPI